jgi:hypothetical protein
MPLGRLTGARRRFKVSERSAKHLLDRQGSAQTLVDSSGLGLRVLVCSTVGRCLGTATSREPNRVGLMSPEFELAMESLSLHISKRHTRPTGTMGSAIELP